MKKSYVARVTSTKGISIFSTTSLFILSMALVSHVAFSQAKSQSIKASEPTLEFTNLKTLQDTAILIGQTFVKDLSEKKFENMPVLFSDNILFRALIPPSMINSSSPAEVARYFKRWLTMESPAKSELVDSNVEMIGNCLHINYKMVETEANGTTSYLEQQLYCDIVKGKIQRLSLVCTGSRKFKN